MIVKAIKTRKFIPPKDDLLDLLSNIKELKENSIVAVTSKVVAIGEGQCIEISKINKEKLIIAEADKYLPREEVPNGLVMHTIKNNMLVASSGVDESNGDGYYILWPKDPLESAKRIWKFLKEKFNVKNIGVIITDSRLTPLRQGVVGYSIGYFGFIPIKDYRGRIDLFGRKFEMETSNIPDSLASAVVLEMGEGAESQPLAVITDIPYIEFIDTEFRPNLGDFGLDIEEEKDIFYPFLSKVNWKKGGRGKKVTF